MRRRPDVFDLEKRLASAQARAAEMAEVLRAVEWNGHTLVHPECPFCGHSQPQGHAPDCRLSALLSPSPSARPAAEETESRLPSTCPECGTAGAPEETSGAPVMRCPTCRTTWGPAPCPTDGACETCGHPHGMHMAVGDGLPPTAGGCAGRCLECARPGEKERT